MSELRVEATAVYTTATHDRGNHETRSTEELIRAAHQLPVLAGLSPAKVSKMVRQFQRDADVHETPFEVWAVNVMTCPAEAPKPYRDLFGIVDSTGETAVRRVQQEREQVSACATA